MNANGTRFLWSFLWQQGLDRGRSAAILIRHLVHITMRITTAFTLMGIRASRSVFVAKLEFHRGILASGAVNMIDRERL